MKMTVNLSGGSYDIIIERGVLSRVEELLNLDRKVLIVTDDNVPKEYSESVAKKSLHPVTVVLPNGEGTKCLDSYKLLLEKMVTESFTRSDCVVAVGGGVIGDLAGFVASSFMRGVDFYNIPTTLLAQVDSSIGGKVAIDFMGYKNIVGAFYQPKRVIIDADTLKTLPYRQIANGLAESVKMALTSDSELFGIFENDNIADNIDKIIEASLIIKKGVVEQDEKESNLRKILNFGHTVAHGIESDSEMQEWYHGECVAVGMLPMCSEEVRLKLIKVLNKIGLPTEIKCDAKRVIKAMSHDKKMSGDKITVVTVEKVGSFKMEEIPFKILSERIEEVL
ncbi:MAG: 3-dehydroquinate synthase [Ruminococcaceae bacterium]|nr:3-dehydroquinate synthase [Oscillospiraceae bacterium]